MPLSYLGGTDLIGSAQMFILILIVTLSTLLKHTLISISKQKDLMQTIFPLHKVLLIIPTFFSKENSVDS